MAECFVSELNKNINSSSKQSSDVPSCQEVKTEEVMEPLLLEDFHKSNIPMSLVKLMKVFDGQGLIPSKTDLLVECFHVLMLEHGFVPLEKQNDYKSCEFSYERLKELVPVLTWKKNDDVTYTSSFILAPYYLYVCKVSCIKMGDDLVINTFVRNIEETHCTAMIDILSYYTDSVSLPGDIMKMQNLKGFSKLVKDRIAFPIKHAILLKVEHRHACLEDLPLEIIYYIFRFIHGVDIVRLTTTCKRLYMIRQEAKLWEYLLKRDYDISMKKEDYKELFEKYGLVHRSKKQNIREDVWIPRYTYRITENSQF